MTSKCDICGKSYDTYPIILSSNPLSLSLFFIDEERPDGTMRSICKECREKEKVKQ
jgi:hypothetical protein